MICSSIYVEGITGLILMVFSTQARKEIYDWNYSFFFSIRIDRIYKCENKEREREGEKEIKEGESKQENKVK